MVLVAVAGGTSPALGKSIVQAILATGKHKAIILSRAKSGGPSSATRSHAQYGAPIHYVDYNSVESLATPLQGVDTVISVLKMVEPGAMTRAHTNLLIACKSANVSRFIMSDWSMAIKAHSKVDILAHKGELLQLCEQENNDPSSTVACSTIQVAMFMNYLAQGSPNATKDDADELTGGLVDDFMLEYVDIANKKLVIPVSSSGTPTPTSTTHLLDIGQLIALSLDLPPNTMRGPLGLTSQEITFAQVHDLLKSKCGMDLPKKTISRADCDSIAADCGAKSDQAMAEGKFDMQAFMGKVVAQMVGVMCDDGDSVVKPTLNRLLAEHGIEVKTRKVEDLLVRAWT